MFAGCDTLIVYQVLALTWNKSWPPFSVIPQLLRNAKTTPRQRLPLAAARTCDASAGTHVGAS